MLPDRWDVRSLRRTWRWAGRLLLCTIVVFSVGACASEGCDGSGPSVLAITPAEVTLAPGGKQAFRVSGTGVWDIVDTVGIHNPNGGSIDPSGNYTAPNQPGDYLVQFKHYASGDALHVNLLQTLLAVVHVLPGGDASVTVK